MKKLFLFTLLLSFSGLVQSQSAPTFHVDVQGKGQESIIFIPGFSCDGSVWKKTVAQLKGQFQCHILTMAGFAGQARADDPSFDNWTQEVANYITDHQLEGSKIIGHSMGGIMALQLAAKFPNLMDKVIVVDALPCLSALSNSSFVSDENMDCTPAIAMMTNQTDEQFVAMQRMSVGSLCANAEKHDQIINWAKESDRATLGKIYCELTQVDLRKEISKIEVEVLVLLEAPFKNLNSQIQQQYQSLANAEIKYATKGLHFIMYDDTAWYLDQVESFLK